MYNPLDLSGKRILITGASSGIGRACAVLCSRLGAETVLVARREAALIETREMLEGTRHQVVPYDLENLTDIESIFRAATRDGVLSGLVHAGGVCLAMPIQYQLMDDIERMMRVNYYSFLVQMRYIAKKMYCNNGSVVAISSVSSEAGWPGGSAYSGTKGALSASVRSLAVELISRGIRVNGVVPSNIKTDMYDFIAGDINDGKGIERLLAKQPLGLGDPIDVAHTVAFLLSDAARFITGSNLVVDGGYLAQ